jgi:nicotinate-nucleotide adenylyltransferase
MPPYPIEKRAILGGSFDPIHWGHLGIAYTALSQVGLTEIIWVTDRHKRDPHRACRIEWTHRQEMVRLAIAPEPAFSLGPTPEPETPYAIHTWQALEQRYPQTQWYWIIGADAFVTLPKWYHAVELAQACEWLVAPRAPVCDPHLAIPGFSPRDQETHNTQGYSRFHGHPRLDMDPTEQAKTAEICQQVAIAFAARQVNLRWQILQSPTLAVGSTLLRRHWSDCPHIQTWVPKPVQIYIQTHHLY